MTSTPITTEEEIKSWLKVILKNEGLEDLSIDNEGNTEKGSGYTGDIFFLKVHGITKDKSKKEYNLVLKCARRNTAFRSKFPVKVAFLNEKYFYETILPYFTKFQSEKGVEEPFDKVAKCYGSIIEDGLEVIVFENLKSKGYAMWDKKKPLTRQQIEMILPEYAKFHAISMTLKDQKPEEFQQLAEKCDDFLGKIYEYTDMITTHEELVDEIYDVLKGELDDDILAKWKSLKPKLRPFLIKFKEGFEGLNVIVHSDCWINNLILYAQNIKPANFAILDWQMTKLSSPIVDVSYFLFACLGPDDINDIDSLLELYYHSLTAYIKRLGSDPDKLYPFDQLLEDWKKYSLFGLNFSCLIHKFSLTDGDEVPDFVQAAENGDVAASMAVPVSDVAAFRRRMRYIVKYVVEHELV